MAVEQRRGCGFRRAGGLYVRGNVAGAAVDWLPFCIPFRQTRSLQWVTSEALLATCADGGTSIFRSHRRIALCFVGAKHYSVDSFVKEALAQGVSRRVSTIPKDLKPGDPIALAHPQCIPTLRVGAVTDDPYQHRAAIHCDACSNVPAAKAVANAHVQVTRSLLKTAIVAEKALGHSAKTLTEQLNGITGWGDPTHVAGVFGLFHMQQVEVVLPASVASDPDIIAKCAERQVRIVSVPDDDHDHVQPGWKLPRFLLDDEDDEDTVEAAPTSAVTAATEDLA